MMVLREYEDFTIPTGRTGPSSKPRRCARCPMASPTWTSFGFSDATASGA